MKKLNIRWDVLLVVKGLLVMYHDVSWLLLRSDRLIQVPVPVMRGLLLGLPVHVEFFVANVPAGVYFPLCIFALTLLQNASTLRSPDQGADPRHCRIPVRQQGRSPVYPPRSPERPTVPVCPAVLCLQHDQVQDEPGHLQRHGPRPQGLCPAGVCF